MKNDRTNVLFGNDNYDRHNYCLGMDKQFLRRGCEQHKGSISMDKNEQQITYLVLKIGDEVFSTEYFKKKKHSIDFKRKDESENIWIQGTFSESTGHVVMDEPIKFELNIYLGGKKEK